MIHSFYFIISVAWRLCWWSSELFRLDTLFLC